MPKIVDKFSNELVIGGTEIVLWLAQKNSKNKRKRTIGEVATIVDGRHMVKLRRKNEHVFLKADAWGLNWMLIDNLPLNTPIMIHNTDTGRRYYLTVEEIKAKKDYLLFKEQGYELQVFIPLDQWNETLTPIKSATL